MRKVSVWAGLAIASLLAGCSPAAPTVTDENSIRAEAATAAVPIEEKLPAVTDGQGNELDPVLADAFRAKMEEDKAAAEEAEQAAREKGETDAAQAAASQPDNQT